MTATSNLIKPLSAAKVYRINYPMSNRLLQDAIEQHNAKCAPGAKIRAVHRTLCEKLMLMYCNRFRSWQAQNGFIFDPERSPLPTLDANNMFLAEIMSCTDRSIRNYRHRLEALGFIQHTIFHGTNANYELQINPAFLWLTSGKDTTRIVPQVQSFPLISTGTLPELLPELVPELIGGKLCSQPERPEQPTNHDAENKPERPEQPEPHYRNETSELVARTAPPVAPPPPKPEHERSARALVSITLPSLYPGRVWSQDERERTEKAVALLFAPVPTSKTGRVLENYSSRCYMACALWESKTGTPLPDPWDWFDYRNPNGFRLTGFWSPDELDQPQPTTQRPRIHMANSAKHTGLVKIGDLFQNITQ